MSDDGKGILGDWDATGEEIRQAMGRAISAALGEHKRAGNSVAVWDSETERVAIVPPEEIVLPDEGEGWDSVIDVRDISPEVPHEHRDPTADGG